MPMMVLLSLICIVVDQAFLPRHSIAYLVFKISEYFFDTGFLFKVSFLVSKICEDREVWSKLEQKID